MAGVCGDAPPRLRWWRLALKPDSRKTEEAAQVNLRWVWQTIHVQYPLLPVHTQKESVHVERKEMKGDMYIDIFNIHPFKYRKQCIFEIFAMGN